MDQVKFKSLRLHPNSLHTVSGQTGSGKTALLSSVADRIHSETGKHLYIVVREDDRPIEEYGLPDWIHSLKPEKPHPLDSIILGDDWQRIAPSRRAMSDINVTIDELLGLSRHNAIDYLLDVQTYSSLDRNSLIRSDYMWFKKPYAREVQFARPEIREDTLAASEALGDAPITSAYVSSPNRADFTGVVTDVPLPSWWSDELSTMHRRTPPGAWKRLKIW